MYIPDVAPSEEQQAEFIFVVEESGHNLDVIQHVRLLVERLDSVAGRAGLATKYGLVSFGGQGIHSTPHTHTVNGRVMGDVRAFYQSLASLKLSMGPTNADVDTAVSLAASYPFHSAASKNIVLITEGLVCPSVPVSNNIKLHVLTQHQFQHTNTSPSTSFIFGN